MEEFLAWEKAHLGILNRVKMPQRVAMFLGTWEEPKAVEPEPVVVEEPQAEEPQAERSLAEEREHKEDVPFYGRRRRDQGKFREDVMLNCGGR
ncbi:HNH endonuclease, partial [Salmonella enterica subsp. enterica serovar Indiana]|nr:HNH endonuclease [Salmonella enterica subsp. enterica serovar Indiana]